MNDTVNFNELPPGALFSTSIFPHSLSDGIVKTATLQELGNLIQVQTGISFQGGLAIADTPTNDGFYFASETGTYTNAGSLVTDLANGLNIIVVEATQTTFQLIVVPLTQNTISEVTSQRRSVAVNEAGVYDSLLTKPTLVASDNLFDESQVILGFYVNNGTGNNSDVTGSNSSRYAISPWIPISDTDYYLQGRNDGHIGDRAIRYKDASETILKPLESDGVTERADYDMEAANGRLYFPSTATHVQFTVKFNVDDLPSEIMLSEGTEEKDYQSFQLVVSSDNLRMPDTVQDDQIVKGSTLKEYIINNDELYDKIEYDYNVLNGQFTSAGNGSTVITTDSNAQETDWINIQESDLAFIEGRKGNETVVFRDFLGNLIKPVDENNSTQDFYWLNRNNGRLYFPENAVEVKITIQRTGTETTNFSFHKLKIKNSLVDGNDNVEMFLPDEIETYVGDTIQLFKYSFSNVYNPDNYYFEVVSDKAVGSGFAGDDYPEYWEFTATEVEEFNIDVFLNTNSGYQLSKKRIKIKVSNTPSSPPSNLNVSFFGDSLTWYNRLGDEFKRVLTSSDALVTNYNDLLSTNTVYRFAGKNLSNITLVGTQKTNYIGWTGQEFHEGYSGKELNWLVTNEDSPLVNSGVFGFTNYLSTNSISGIDVLYLGFGWNDITKSMKSNNDVEGIKADLRTFLRAVNTDMNGCKVYLWSENFPSLRGGDGNHGWGSDKRVNMHMWKIRLQNIFKAYQEIANESEFNGFVKFIGSHIMYDAQNMNALSTKRKNTRIADTTPIGTDEVHPSDGGFFMLADALVRSFVYNHC